MLELATADVVSTSMMAWEDLVVSGVIPALHNRILVALVLQDHEGATSAEVCRLLFGEDWGRALQSITPRFRELEKRGLVYKTRERRCDPVTKRTRTVWSLTDQGRDCARSLVRLSAINKRS